MVILISLILALALAWFGAKVIKKYANVFYFGSGLISIAVIIIMWTGGFASFPRWVSTVVWPLFSRGAFASALFILVMFIGALPNRSVAIRRLMPVRAELSIIASFLILGHNIAYGKTYFVKLFSPTANMAVTQQLAAICSLIMIAIMLPLMVTSFPSIRRKMNAKTWKKLQRFAYVFYGLIYSHIMLLYVPLLQNGFTSYRINVVLYSVIFFGYAAMRLRKAYKQKNCSVGVGTAPVLSALLCVAVCVISCIPWKTVTVVPSNHGTVAEESTDALQEETPTPTPTPTVTTESDVPTNSPSVSEEEPADAAIDQEPVTYTDGTYFGEGTGFNGQITVAVRIADGSIQRITVVTTPDDADFWKKAVTLIDNVLAVQTAQVDSVSGATYSSNGLKEAIADALEQASVGE